jgi:hypothetical protein
MQQAHVPPPRNMSWRGARSSSSNGNLTRGPPTMPATAPTARFPSFGSSLVLPLHLSTRPDASCFYMGRRDRMGSRPLPSLEDRCRDPAPAPSSLLYTRGVPAPHRPAGGASSRRRLEVAASLSFSPLRSGATPSPCLRCSARCTHLSLVSHLLFQRKPSAYLYACQDQVSCI